MKLNIREAAEMLGVSETRLYRWVDEGDIPFVTIQHRPVFHRLELLEWAMERDLPISIDLYEDLTESPLATALELGGGHVMAAAGLSQIVDDLPIVHEDREVIRAVIAARSGEMFRPHDGIAIPTPRSPLICPQLPPTLMLWWCRELSIQVGGEAVKAVFVIATPTILDHLQLLSRLSLVLRDDGFAQAVKRMSPVASVIAEARRVGQKIEVARSGQWGVTK